MNSLDKIEIYSHPNKEYEKVIIMLHGLGASGHDFIDLPKAFKFNDSLKIKYIFPHALEIPITVNGGVVMPAWYDIKNIQIEREYNKNTLMTSLKLLEKILIEEVNKGIKEKNIILGGFSQGGATSFVLASNSSFNLGGVFILSAYLLDPIELEEKAPSLINKKINFFMAHGKNDSVIPFSLADNHQRLLKEKNIPLNWYEYEHGHNLIPLEINDLKKWIDQIWEKNYE